jgi:hypothetical protein
MSDQPKIELQRCKCTKCGEMSLSAIWCEKCTPKPAGRANGSYSIAREQYVAAWYEKQRLG